VHYVFASNYSLPANKTDRRIAMLLRRCTRHQSIRIPSREQRSPSELIDSALLASRTMITRDELCGWSKFGSNNKWSMQSDMRPHRARIVPSYLSGGANVHAIHTSLPPNGSCIGPAASAGRIDVSDTTTRRLRTWRHVWP